MFEHVEPYLGDPILTLNEAFGQDPRSSKVNLSIGIYFDDDGQLPVMRAVREAEASMAGTVSARPYLPMEGLAAYRQAVQHLLWGADHEAVKSQRIATIQTVGGSGGLKVGGDFLKSYFPDSDVWVSDPTWDNHQSIFQGAGLKVHSYPYHDPRSGGLRFDDMLATLQNVLPHSIVLLHACCHNPTGIDLSDSQWQALIPVIQSRQLIPFLDMAYQGFGEGLVEDAAALHALTNAGISFFCANSFSKNFSLYGERCGALSVVCANASQASRVLGQLKSTVRKNYSSPPSHGARLVAQVLQTPALYTAWADELGTMRQRIKSMRQHIAEGLASVLPGYDVSRFTRQRGMFSYTGLNEAQVATLRDRHGVYLVRSGRMCVAGLNSRNLGLVIEALAAVITETR